MQGKGLSYLLQQTCTNGVLCRTMPLQLLLHV
jgi:hypothetical protein